MAMQTLPKPDVGVHQSQLPPGGPVDTTKDMLAEPQLPSKVQWPINLHDTLQLVLTNESAEAARNKARKLLFGDQPIISEWDCS